MAVRAANLKGCKFLENPVGEDKGGVALLTFDLVNTVFTGGADTITIGGAGTDQGVVTALTLATLMQNRRRDGKVVTLTGVAGASVTPGLQAGTLLYVQAAAVSAGNIISMTLNTAATGGAGASSTAAAWDRAAAIAVTYTAV